ncbi:MAG: hypothetical protein ABIW84_00685 [Ilumatobacteraceae bacterium]
MSVRLVVAILLLAALAGGLWWTASLTPESKKVVTAEFPVFVVGPEGDVLANGTVLAQGTPFDVLQALATERGFAVEVEQQTWIGSGCTAQYIVGIAGHRESVTGGWNYYTRQPGGNWTWQAAGAACHVLQHGDQVEWCWVETDVCRHHVA